jgi:hypothetical protein
VKVTYSQIAGGYEFSNTLGKFVVYSDTGFVSKWTTGGKVISQRTPGFTSANDPACGGLFLPAWHHYRDNGETDIWRKGWEVNPLRKSPCGVKTGRCIQTPQYDDLGRVWASFETIFDDIYGIVMRVRHDYLVREKFVDCWITFTQLWDGSGATAYLKEPKIVMSLNHAKLIELALVYDGPHDLLQTHNLTKVVNPAKHTLQLRNPIRKSVKFEPLGVAITALAAQPMNRVVFGWVDNELGLDGWAEESNFRKAFEPPDNDKPYCRQGPSGTLTRNWEIAKRGENEVSLMLHGWEGGSGLPDCLGCARIFGISGESWRNFVSISKGG